MNDIYTKSGSKKAPTTNYGSVSPGHRSMIRISIYHWLPIADNMLSEIEKNLRALPLTRVNDIEMERDAVSFNTVFQFRRDFRSVAVFPIHGKISHRGFCQHVLNVAPIPGLPLNALLNELVPELKREIAELIFVLAPEAVRTKLAILETGITPFQQFQSITLDPPMDHPARAFLTSSPVTAIALDEFQADSMRWGFAIPALDLKIPARDTDSATYTNDCGDCFLFYSNVYHPDEWAIHDSVLYKYCAIVLYARFLEHTISILKQTRDHMIPLRRRLASALQGNITEYFEALTQIKRYLSYVNIKLPLVQKVIHQLQVTRESETFVATIATFDEPAKVFGYPAIRSIDDSFWQPHYLIEKVEHESESVQAIFDEDVQEIQIISAELSQVLEGSLLSEQLQVSTRSLDAAQAMLEIQRSTKILANTNKWMMVLLLSAFGALIAMTFGAGFAWALVVGVSLLMLGYLVTNFAQRRHKSNYRLVVPIRAHLSPETLAAWVSTHDVTKNQTNGDQITCTWREKIRVEVFKRNSLFYRTRVKLAERFKLEWLRPDPRQRHTFDFTVDARRRGFLYSITLEKEHSTALFSQKDLVDAVFSRLREGGCLDEAAESSLYANALSMLEIPLDRQLPALNKLLTLPSTQVSYIVKTGASHQEDSMSRQELFVMQDISAQPHAYREWLTDALTDAENENLLALLGNGNVRQKLKLLEKLEEGHVKRT